MARILIADDSPTERQVYAEALRELGHELVEAENGEEAERRFNETHPDLMILDVVMPKKDGYQVCRSLKSRKENRRVPIIMISAKSLTSDVYWGLKQGATEYLSKPFQVGVLLDKVKRYLA